jgi:hypothetical protein
VSSDANCGLKALLDGRLLADHAEQFHGVGSQGEPGVVEQCDAGLRGQESVLA